MDVYIGFIFPSAIISYAPRGFMFCAGQQLSIQQYTALYALVGTKYGGDGQNTFKIPDLQGRVIVGAGNGLGLTPRVIATNGGAETTSLGITNMPLHTHGATFQGTGGGNANPLSVSVKVSTKEATETICGTNNANTLAAPYYTDGGATVAGYVNDNAPTIPLGGVSSSGGGGGITGGVVTVLPTGAGTPFNNMQPFLVLNYIIAVEGLYPPRN